MGDVQTANDVSVLSLKFAENSLYRFGAFSHISSSRASNYNDLAVFEQHIQLF